MRPLLIIFALLCSLPARASIDTLFELIDERLELMDEVAAWKWRHHVAIEDLAREAIVLDSASGSALNHGLDPSTARTFFAAQIDAAKAIQAHWFDHYESAPPRGPVTELAAIRPELLALGDAITKALATTRSLDERDRQAFMNRVSVEGLPPETAGRIFDALMGISRYPSRLDQILSTGRLRVGTTGDYAPFSDSADGERFVGIDIDMATDLGQSLGVEVDFVQTSWPTLMEDLSAGRYDIAMSGVSRTLARQRVGYFSPPYHVGGKTPIARCEDRQALDSLEEINSENVRVIVNPGGTNHRFAEANITTAQLMIFEDNRSIFDEIAAGRADVMITDAIEVRLKAAQIDSLCATMPGETFTYQEKAYLMPRDEPLSAFVRTWLELRIADGTVARVMDRHLR